MNVLNRNKKVCALSVCTEKWEAIIEKLKKDEYYYYYKSFYSFTYA